MALERLFVPGRLCLFGEHSDWAGGYAAADASIPPGLCLACGTTQGLTSRAHITPGHLALSSVAGPDARWPADIPLLLDLAAQGGFWSYAAGTFAEVMAAFPQVTGLTLRCHAMDLPLKKGLSSSAALCVTVVRACEQLYGLGLSVERIMELAYRGERRTPSQCGRLDQVCAYGQRVVKMVFKGDGLHVSPVKLGGPVSLMIVDLGGQKSTVRILRDLQACFPDTPGRLARAVRRALGEGNLAIGRAALDALSHGDAPLLGQLMTEAQALFDRDVAPASPDQLAAPRLHALMELPALGPLIFGGKGVGSQGDGTAQLIARDAEARARAAAIIKEKLGMNTYKLDITPGYQPQLMSASHSQ